MAFNLHKFVLFGDSITRRSQDLAWGFNLAPALAADYNCKLDIVTRGFAGYNTEMARHLVESIIRAEGGETGTGSGSRSGSRITMMTVHFGTNDASTGIHHVPIEDYSANLTFVVRTIVEHGIKPLVIGPSLHDNVDTNTTHSSKLNRDYSEAARKVADHFGVPYIDLWTVFAQEVGWTPASEYPTSGMGHLFIDGVHFTRRGYELYYRELKKAIKENYPEHDAEAMASQYVPCAELLKKNQDLKHIVETWTPEKKVAQCCRG